jgi:hypothetical protein
VDPDGCASRFGARAEGGDFAGGLAWLLERDRWRERGIRGYAHVRDTFELHRAVDDHIAVYDELVRGPLEEELDTLQEGSLAG